MTTSFDIVGLGCAAVDDILYVAAYPPVDDKTRVTDSRRQFGGLTGTALVAAARLGARCAYAGCLGTDELSGYVAAHLAREGVDTSHAPRLSEARVVHSTVVVGRDAGSRNVFYEVGGLTGAHPTLPAEELIGDCRVLFLDHYGMAGNLRAARLARAARRAVVADFEEAAEPSFGVLLDLVDHLILSSDFALRITRAASPAAAACALWQPSRAAVIVTCGADGCWSVSAEAPGEARHHAAFAVHASDTTGCGDVFHGAYAASLAGGDALEDRIRFAAAAAALKAARTDIPDRDAVERFLACQGGAG